MWKRCGNGAKYVNSGKCEILNESEDRTGEYWPEVVAGRTEQSDLGPIFPCATRASSVSKLFIIWYCVKPVSVSTSKVSRSSG